MTLLEKKVDALMRFAAAEEFERDSLRAEIRSLLCEEEHVPVVTERELVIRKTLMELGAPESHNGYVFMVDALMLAMEDDINTMNMTWGIYAPIALKRNTDIDKVRRSISFAVDKICERAPGKLMNKYFYGLLSENKNHVTANEFIGRMAVVLKYGFDGKGETRCR